MCMQSLFVTGTGTRYTAAAPQTEELAKQSCYAGAPQDVHIVTAYHMSMHAWVQAHVSHVPHVPLTEGLTQQSCYGDAQGGEDRQQ